MERGGNGEQGLPDHEKAEPDEHYGDHAEGGQGQAGETARTLGDGCGKLGQAGRAEDALIVLGDTLTAEKSLTLRAASDGLTVGMVQASPLDERGHGAGGACC